MRRPPRVVRQWAQPTTGGGAQAEQKARENAALPQRAVVDGQFIGFFGHTSTGDFRTFSVLAGEGAPTPVGGWAKIATIDRPGRVGYTVPTGYDPIVMKVPILFEAVMKTRDRPDIENDVLKLEWMAGREPNPPGGEVKGPPPYVEVFTLDSNGTSIPLVPKQFQSEPGRSRQWWISDIQFDETTAGCKRDSGGARIRQAAVVILTEIVSTTGAIAQNRKAREAVKGKFETVRSDTSANTIKRVAAREGIPSAWKAILEANRKLGASAEKPLKVGTAIKIPLTAFRQVPA